jgi:hypothetical protein
MIRNPTPADLAKHKRWMKVVAIAGVATALIRLMDAWSNTHHPHHTLPAHANDPDPSVLAAVQKSIDIANQQMPRVINRETKALNMHVLADGTVVYHYELSSGAPTEQDRDAMKKRLTNNYCTSPDLAVFRRYSLPNRWDYYTPDGRFLLQITVTNADCR